LLADIYHQHLHKRNEIFELYLSETTTKPLDPPKIEFDLSIAGDATSTNVFSQWVMKSESITSERYRGPLGQFSWEATFKGEDRARGTGLFRESMAKMCEELRTMAEEQPPSPNSLFILCPNGTHQVGMDRNKLILNPSLHSPQDFTRLYRFGQLMGCAIRSTEILALDLAGFFWRTLLYGSDRPGMEEALQELATFDLNAYNLIQFIDPETNSEWDKDEFEDKSNNLTFMTVLSDGRTIELFPGGTTQRVSYEDRWRYAELVVKTRLDESRAQMEVVREGLLSVIPSTSASYPAHLFGCAYVPCFSLLSWRELELRICGEAKIDLSLLKFCTKYQNADEKSPIIINLWKVLEDFPEKDRERFLQFVWARSRLDFDMSSKRLNVVVQDLLNQEATDALMPTSQTCMFQLKLPNYSNIDLLRKKLSTALHCSTMNLE